MTTFHGLPVLRKTKVDRIVRNDLNVIVQTDMNDYSGWGYQEHLEWICELSGLSYVPLVQAVCDGYLVLTDEAVSEVWLVSKDYHKSTARLLYTD
jgi:hypothetical protein